MTITRQKCHSTESQQTICWKTLLQNMRRIIQPDRQCIHSLGFDRWIILRRVFYYLRKYAGAQAQTGGLLNAQPWLSFRSI